MLTASKEQHKRIEKTRMMEKHDVITMGDTNGDDCETNSRTSEGNCRVHRRRKSAGSVQHRRSLGLAKSFSSMRFLPLDNDVEEEQQLQKTPVKELASSTLTWSPCDTPSTVASTLFSGSKSTIFSNVNSPTQRRSSSVEKKHADAAPPLPPRRCRSGSVSAHRRRTSVGSRISRQSHQSAQRSHASAVANAARLEALEDEMDRLNGELNDVELAQQNMQHEKADAEIRQQQLQQEFEALQNDVSQKLAQIESFESENDRLQEECLHFETQVFSMTKSLEACVTERDAKNREYILVHEEWDKMHQLGSELLQALHDHHTGASSPDHVDLELHFRRQQEVLDELQEEVRQLREEVRSYQIDSKPASSGPTVFIIPDPPQFRSIGASPKRTYSLTPHAANSSGSISSGSSQSRDVDVKDNKEETTKERRKLAAQQLRQDLKERRQRRSSLATQGSR